jgi:hypothetical protein
MPTPQGDAQIELVQKAHAKLQAFHAMFGEDSKIFTKAEEIIAYNNDPDKLKAMLEGEESVYERYIAELKAFRDSNPIEYQRITELKPPFTQAKKADTHETLCVVKTEKGKELYIAVDNETAQNIPTIAMLEKLCCKPDARAESLPENLEKTHEKAIDTYRTFFDRMLTARQQNQQNKEAVKIVVELYKKTTDNQSKELLTLARKFVEKGNVSLAKRIISLNQQINENQLFAVNQNDFNALIYSELVALKNRADEQTGSPEVVLSMTNV